MQTGVKEYKRVRMGAMGSGGTGEYKNKAGKAKKMYLQGIFVPLGRTLTVGYSFFRNG